VNLGPGAERVNIIVVFVNMNDVRHGCEPR